jgi:hypothetical protein
MADLDPAVLMLIAAGALALAALLLFLWAPFPARRRR